MDTRNALDIEKAALDSLDFPRVREAIASCAVSEEGAAALRERHPYGRGGEGIMASLKAEAVEWVPFITAGEDRAALPPWPPVADIFPLLGVENTVLSAAQEHGLRLFCRAAVIFAESPYNRKQAAPIDIAALRDTEKTILAVVDRDGNIRDLPSLRAIRRTIERLSADVESALRAHLLAPAGRGDVFAGNLPVLRDGRQVLAVRARYKNTVRGIVHAVSQSAQTVYIEPDNVVSLHNDIAEEKARLDREIRRILSDLTRAVAAHAESIEAAHGFLVHADTTLAAARWGIKAGGVFAGNGGARLLQASHPLLGAAAVPIDLGFDSQKRVLVISGPNTGGKTVAMKTFALAVLLNQAGFPVPASPGTVLPVFDRVCADIGDGQSIDENLSYFSAHIRRIARAVDRADRHTLVLLDELGSATESEEGGAISLAVLDALISRGAYVLATTHHGAVKNYAFRCDACQNVSASFDAERLVPTYRFIQGVPGQSYAIDMAAHYGLAPEIVENARRYFAGGSADAASLIKALGEQSRKVMETASALEEQRRTLERKGAKLAEKEGEVKKAEALLRESDRRELRRFTSEARSTLENLVRSLREKGSADAEEISRVKAFISSLTAAEAESAADTKIAAETEGTVDAENTGENRPGDFAPGLPVRVKNHPQVSASLIGRAGNGRWLVQAGAVKITVAEDDLRVCGSGGVRREGSGNGDSFPGTSRVAVDFSGTDFAREKPAFELRLLGMRAADALKALDKQVDLAAFYGLGEFAVVHGKGDGILQEAVWTHLGKSAVVSGCRFAAPEDGGSGKTYVTLVSVPRSAHSMAENRR